MISSMRPACPSLTDHDELLALESGVQVSFKRQNSVLHFLISVLATASRCTMAEWLFADIEKVGKRAHFSEATRGDVEIL